MERQRSLATSWGALVARHRLIVVAAWALAVGALAILASGTPRLLSPAGFEADTEASRAADLLREQFPERVTPVLTVVFQSDRTPAGDLGYQRQVAAWRSDLERLAPSGTAAIEGPLVGRNGRTVALVVTSNSTPDHFIELGRRADAIRHPGPAHVLLGGYAAVYDAFVAESEEDLQQSERLSAPIALALLLLVFGGLVAGLLPVLTGLATVTVAIALIGVVARFHTLSVFSLNVTSVVGLGLGIDYSLLVVNRFREEMRRGRSVEEAVAATVGTAGLATVVSGGTVAIGFGALTLSHLNVLWSIGLGGAIVVLISVVASLTLIPALLAIFGRHIDRLTLPFARTGGPSRAWHDLAGRVMRRPFVYIALSVAVIALLLAPARSLRLGVGGPESLPPDHPAAEATSVAQRDLGFPARSPVLVVASGVDGLEQAAEVERRLRAAADGQPVVGPQDVPAAQLPLYLRGGHAVFEVEQPAGDNDDRTLRWLDRIRSTEWPAGVHVQLGGEAPAYQDFVRVLTGDAPLIVGTVLCLTFVLLALAFRSVALPIKAVLMNLLSVGAALGVLTWGFQDGGLARVFDFRVVGFVDATVPVIIFAGLFGLSMDYEVFLLSRIREEWTAGHANAAAVAAGMERTGRIITSAALILVVVVSTLAFSHLTLNKSFGVTFAVAILLDATVIRLLLVPAMMRVLGDLNWWPARRPAARDRAEAA